MGLNEVPYVFVGFWDGDYVSQLPYVWYYVGVKSSCCLPTPMTLSSGGSPMFPLVVHQPASPSI